MGETVRMIKFRVALLISVVINKIFNMYFESPCHFKRDNLRHLNSTRLKFAIWEKRKINWGEYVLIYSEYFLRGVCL